MNAVWDGQFWMVSPRHLGADRPNFHPVESQRRQKERVHVYGFLHISNALLLCVQATVWQSGREGLRGL